MTPEERKALDDLKQLAETAGTTSKPRLHAALTHRAIEKLMTGSWTGTGRQPHAWNGYYPLMAFPYQDGLQPHQRSLMELLRRRGEPTVTWEIRPLEMDLSSVERRVQAAMLAKEQKPWSSTFAVDIDSYASDHRAYQPLHRFHEWDHHDQPNLSKLCDSLSFLRFRLPRARRLFLWLSRTWNAWGFPSTSWAS